MTDLQPSNAPRGAGKSQGVLLVVDDSEVDVDLLHRALKKAEIELPILHLEDGETAAQYLSASDAPIPSLILLDIQMPRMDGFEILAWLRSNPKLAEVPVIIWSSSNLEIDKSRANSLGALDYLVKPIDAKDFITIVEKLMEKWRSA